MTQKIYTKTGDNGQTSLIGGSRVSKSHIRIEAYGTIDELNSHIGLLRDQQFPEKEKVLLLEIQDRLFTIGSLLAAEADSKMKLPGLGQNDVVLLEKEMDQISNELPPLKQFVLPGGHQAVSFCHIARCVCRRAERKVVHLSVQEPVDELVVIYLNRLSDYLFMLSRKLAVIFSVTEQPWKPRL